MNNEKHPDNHVSGNILNPVKGSPKRDGQPVEEKASGIAPRRSSQTPMRTPMMKDNKLRGLKNSSGSKFSSRPTGVKEDIVVTVQNTTREAAQVVHSSTLPNESSTRRMELTVRRRPCSSSQEVYSPSLLPPINPCLKGTCPFAQVLRNEKNPVWLGCQFKNEQTRSKCNYWVHARCHGFPKMSMRVVKLAKGFRCPRHLV